eukprot:1512297-Pleurochrysis_carterae.AAC.4
MGRDQYVNWLDGNGKQRLTGVRLHVQSVDCRQLGRRCFLEAHALLPLENACEFDFAMRTTRRRHIDRQSAKLGKWPHMRRTVTAENISALCAGARGRVEPLRLRQLAQEAAAIVSDRAVERPSCVCSRHVAAGDDVALNALAVARSGWHVQLGDSLVVPLVAALSSARHGIPLQDAADGRVAADGQVGLEIGVFIAPNIEDYIA